LLPNFSWEHAEDAEPKVVAEKVMSLIDNKNVFIGICTKKECVLQSGSIKKSILYPGQFLLRESECSWKTSDWIIQELGLAKGRDLDIILLIESGVRRPGGLQSDLEYIEFDRSAPDKSFGKIVEMLTALSPKKHITSAIATDAQSADNERNETQPLKDDNWGTPRPEWMRYDYKYAFFEMVITDNQAGADNINSAYLATKDASNEDNKNVWAAYCEFIRLRWGKGGSLANLKVLAELYPDSSRVWKYLAMGFEKYHDYRGVAHAYEIAAIKTKDEIEQIRLLGRAAIAHTCSEAEDFATEIINRMKAQVQESGAGEVEMISALKEIYEIKNDDEALLAIMERMMDLDPSDTKTRFSLAYKHSSIGNDDLALFHYLQIPFDERDSVTWNNLGVAFDRFDLSTKSVLAYRNAEGSGETLAMSNLASKLITVGFLSEPEQICKKALKVENYHKNITHTMARLKDKPDEENKKEADLLEKTKPISDFYTEFGRALSRTEPDDLAKCWQGQTAF
jgi:tetratricopeptide (TPR) repeat protein